MHARSQATEQDGSTTPVSSNLRSEIIPGANTDNQHLESLSIDRTDMPFTGELRVEDSKLNDDYDDDATKQGGSLMDQKFQSGQGSLAAEFNINENNNHNNKA